MTTGAGCGFVLTGRGRGGGDGGGGGGKTDCSDTIGGDLQLALLSDSDVSHVRSISTLGVDLHRCLSASVKPAQGGGVHTTFFKC